MSHSVMDYWETMTKVPLSKARCLMVAGLMVFLFVSSPWDFGPKVINKVVYHQPGTLSVETLNFARAA